jgi:putative flavoprotein involved in K+ transport
MNGEQPNPTPTFLNEAQTGLYFLGLHWLHTIKSGLFFGVADDAAHVTTHIASRSRVRHRSDRVSS